MKSCAYCGAEFTASKPEALYCSGRCRVAAYRARNRPAVTTGVTDNAEITRLKAEIAKLKALFAVKINKTYDSAYDEGWDAGCKAQVAFDVGHDAGVVAASRATEMPSPIPVPDDHADDAEHYREGFEPGFKEYLEA